MAPFDWEYDTDQDLQDSEDANPDQGCDPNEGNEDEGTSNDD